MLSIMASEKSVCAQLRPMKDSIPSNIAPLNNASSSVVLVKLAPDRLALDRFDSKKLAPDMFALVKLAPARYAFQKLAALELPKLDREYVSKAKERSALSNLALARKAS